MDLTRSITTRQNPDASGHKRSKKIDPSGSAPWSQLVHDVLFIIIMKLGTIDFTVFNCVCKSWREFAHSNWKMFMESKQPMKISISTDRRKELECYVEDHERRKFKTVIPHSIGSTCVGLTHGYLIFSGRRSRDFCLVNPITRHEFHFPGLTYPIVTDPARFKGILFRSASLSGWVFIISFRSWNIISFSIAGSGVWNHLSSDLPIHDIHEFQGKLYTLTMGGCLYEVGINLDPTLTLLGMEEAVRPNFLFPQFVSSSGAKLYIMYWNSDTECNVLEADFDKVKWVIKTSPEDYVYFGSQLKNVAVIKRRSWADTRIEYERTSYFLDFLNLNLKDEGWYITKIMWYFPHDCLNANLLQ